MLKVLGLSLCEIGVDHLWHRQFADPFREAGPVFGGLVVDGDKGVIWVASSFRTAIIFWLV